MSDSERVQELIQRLRSARSDSEEYAVALQALRDQRRQEALDAMRNRAPTLICELPK